MTAQQSRLYFEIQRTAHALKQAADAEMLEKAGVSTAQAAVLVMVAHKGAARQNEIAERLEQREAAVTQMVSRLIHKGLLQRERSEDDKRAWCISLTEKGRKCVQGAQAAMGGINAHLDRALAGETAQNFAGMLRIIRSEFSSETKALSDRKAMTGDQLDQ